MLFEWVFCSHLPSVVWKIISSQPKLVLTLGKNQGLSEHEECLEFHLLVVQLFRSQFVDEDEAVCMSPCHSLQNLQPVRGSTAQSYSSTPSNAFSLSYLLTARNGSVFLLGPCQVLVVQSFASSFRLSKVRSSMQWLLSSVSIQCENPVRRNKNSLSFCREVRLVLQGNSVM